MKAILFLIGMLISMHVYASWDPIGPEGIRANKVCFAINNQSQWVICHDTGICIYDPGTQLWTSHPSTLPVLDASYLDGTKIMVIMGEGTFSDGIYAFNPASGEFEIIEWLPFPYFIFYSDDEELYYVGHHSGLMTSPDGYTWTAVDTFTNRGMEAMAAYQNHFVISEIDNLYGVWLSDDYGATWSSPTPGTPMISNLGFDNSGILYGIFPDSSYSSGLWSSSDYGETWENEFYSLNMSCVGFDAQDLVFVGWGENPPLPQEGIAQYTPGTGSLRFINEGLPDLIINDICHNPTMSAIALFCCTENAVYISYDYYLGVQEHPAEISATMIISPNPAHDVAAISYRIPVEEREATLRIMDISGSVIRMSALEKSVGVVYFDCSSISNGVYLISITGLKSDVAKKLVVTHE